MSDLFHPAVPMEHIKQMFAVMRQADWHQFQALTKRSARLLECDDQLDWQPSTSPWVTSKLKQSTAVKEPYFLHKECTSIMGFCKKI